MKAFITKGFLKFIVFLELFVLIAVFLLYLVSEPKTLKYVVDRATSSFDIQYDAVSGNFLKTITLTNLRYKNNLLTTEAQIDLNLRALLRGDIEIETLSLKDINLANLETIIKSTQKEPNKKASKKKLSIPKIAISHLYLTALPYQTKMIKIETFELDVHDITTDLNNIFTIKSFKLSSKNDHAHIQTNGTLKDKELHLNRLFVEQIDIDKLQETLALLPQDNENNKTESNPFIDKISIQDFKASIKAFKHKPYEINTLDLSAQNISGTLKQALFDAENIALKSDTNLGDIKLQGGVSQNRFKGKSTLNLSQKYFQQFTDIVDFQSLNPIKLSIYADKSRIDSSITLKSKQIFAGKFKDYFTSINTFKSQLSYDIPSQTLHATTDANVSNKYAKSLILKDTLSYDKALHYGGTIRLYGLGYFPEFSLPLFKNPLLTYKGDSKDLVANLHTDKLHLLYKMFDFKRADFRLRSKELEIVKYFPKIPKVFHPLLASLDATMALDFNKTDIISVDTNITSNALNLKGKTVFHKGKITASTEATLAKNSFLKENNKAIKLHNIFPAGFDLDYHDSNLTLDLSAKNKNLENHFSYNFKEDTLDEKLILKNDSITLKGKSEHLQVQTHIFSLKTLQESLQPLYTFTKQPYDGEVKIDAVIENFETMQADITSRWLVYEYTPNKFAFGEKIKIKLQADENKAIIQNYKLHAFMDYDRRFFATKPSTILFADNKFEITQLWVNDALKTEGAYDTAKEKGVFKSKANAYHYKGKEGDITFNTNITTTLSGKHTHIEGNLDVLKGRITYENRNNHEIQDPDIIIIQEEKERLAREKEEKNDLSLDITITAKKPLFYDVAPIQVYVTPDLKIWKESQSSLEILGRTIINKGTYVQSDKEFIILPGEVLFDGNIFNPYLNLKAQHTSNPYVIDINIAGTLDSPIINFSSNPYLNQSDILSMLLFSATTDSLFEGSSHSSNQAISMLGNTFAKEIVQNFGLTLDKLVLSTNETGGLGIEIGKKFSKKVTVIYTNDIVQSLKVRYQHSDSFETDLMISPEATGIDFLYKSEH